MINIIRINENFLKLQNNYLFSNINKKVSLFQKNNPDKKIISLGIGDVTRPIVSTVSNAMKKAIYDLENEKSFHGYGPEQGYEFLRKKIIENDYIAKGIRNR